MRPFLVAALVMVAPATAFGQVATGRVSGTVFDSTRARPLSGAAVLVAGTTSRSVTDARGRFLLSDVPVGEVQLFFLHGRLDTLEYTPRSHTVQVTAGANQDILLVLPSAETLAREACASEGTDRRVLEGRVMTTAADAPVANAVVGLRWRGGSATDTTNRYGRYRFCEIPAQERLTLSAGLLGRNAEGDPVSGGEPAYVRRDIRLDFGGDATQLKTSLRPSTGALQVVGHLRDAQSGTPVATANVRLAGTPFQALSNAQGGFAFAHVPAGTYVLEVEHLGYGKREQRFTLPPGVTVDLEVQLAPAAIALSGLTVRALTAEETERRAAPTANRIVGEAQLDAAVARGASMADLLRQHVNGLVIREGTFEATDSNLPQTILCVESKRGPASMPAPRTRRASAVTYPPCDMIPVYVDDSRMSAAGNFLRYTPIDIFVRVEYLPASAAAIRYGMNSENKGVLALYTKRPGKRR
jgi:hypothetical protein